VHRHSVTILLMCLSCAGITHSFSQTDTLRRTRSSQILSTLRGQFQKHNTKISTVEIDEIRTLDAGPFSTTNRVRFLVVARGVRSDERFEGSFEDELFGIFLLDDSLFSILRTIDIIPTQRWGDYAVKIVRYRKDTLTIHGEGVGYGDQQIDKRYYLHLK